MRTFYNCLLLLCLVAGGMPAARAQLILNRQVNASSGGTGIVNTLAFQYTIGDITVSTLSSSGLMLTQGFQQPEELPPIGPGVKPVINMILYPNPAATNLKIQFDMLSNNTVVLIIVNSSGQLIYRDSRSYAAGKIVINLQVSHFAAGIYTVRLLAGGYAFQEKLIIQ